MLYFKIKVGFGPNDFIPIDEEDYRKAVIAQVTGKVAIFKGGETASGSAILTILPDYGRSMGYKREYEVELSEVHRKMLDEFREFGERIKLEVGGEVKKLGP